MLADGPEYLLPSDFDLARVGERLSGRLELGGATTRTGERTFFDTFDRRLRGRGQLLVLEDGVLTLSDGRGRELGRTALSAQPERIRVEQLEPGPLRSALAPVCGVRVLLPTVRVRSNRRSVPVLDGRQKTVARLVTEDAVVADGPAGDNGLDPRLHTLGVRGYDAALGRVRRALEDGLGLSVAKESLHDEAVGRAGHLPTALPTHVAVDGDPALPAEQAAIALAQDLLAAIEVNVPGALADLDSEFLHDMRVAVRRTRALQRELKTIFPPEDLAHFRGEFRWLQQVTGPSRDFDVYLLEFGEFTATVPLSQRDDLEPLRAMLVTRRNAERRRMERALRGERTRRLLDGWGTFLAHMPDAPLDERPDASAPVGKVASTRIARVYRQMARMGAPIDDASPAVALHDLRKKGKELRYLLEFFSPLFPTRVTAPMVRTLKALQDTLGRFQDREVQAAMVRSLGADVAARKGGAEALMAMGVLVERLEEQQAAARAEFAERFAAFASDRQRALVQRTFG